MSRSTKRKPEIDEAALRAQGLVPVTVWTFDMSAPGFQETYERELEMLARADADDPSIDSFLLAAWEEMDFPDE